MVILLNGLLLLRRQAKVFHRVLSPFRRNVVAASFQFSGVLDALVQVPGAFHHFLSQVHEPPLVGTVPYLLFERAPVGIR